MDSAKDIQIVITEGRYQELKDKAARLDSLLAAYPELQDSQKLTPAAKRYKNALEAFVKRVDKVLSSAEMVGIFQVAAIHGCDYKGPSLAQDIADAKKLLGP